MHLGEGMKFKDYAKTEEPALEIFSVTLDRVFDEGDETTEHLDRIGSEARLVYLLWCFDGEILNGGFDQLFFNSLGDHCFEILDSLCEVGALVSSKLLRKAMTWFPESRPSPDREERWRQLEPFREDVKYEEALNELDDKFYEYEDNLAELLHTYVRDNLEASINE